jgi:hypothetical protein
MPNWSIYLQGATGSIVPPSSVYDYNQTAASASAAVPQLTTAPKQQKSTTYQAGTVYKGDRFTIDADAYRIRFQNSYSSTVDNIAGDVDQGDTIYFLQPSSVTQGLEFETTAVLRTRPQPLPQRHGRQCLLRWLGQRRHPGRAVLRAGARRPLGSQHAHRH